MKNISILLFLTLFSNVVLAQHNVKVALSVQQILNSQKKIMLP